MARRTWAAAAAAAFTVFCLALSYRLLVTRRAALPPLPGGPGAPMRPGAMTPIQFEPLLRADPDDRNARDAALYWYSHTHRDYAKLRLHTLEEIARHPDDRLIFAANEGAFFAVPGYRMEAIASFQGQLARGEASSNVYANLGMICSDGALPAPAAGPERKAFTKYLELPAGTPLPERPDPALCKLALQYFQAGYRAANTPGASGAAPPAFFAESEARLLSRLGRAGEALPLLAATLPGVRPDQRADFLVSYGSCLHAAGQAEEAKRILGQVRAVDTEGDRGGPAHATTAAATELGLIALEQGDIPEARHQLIAACQVQTCPHNTTRGLPLSLANKLLAAGQRDVVILYCDEALGKFTPGNEAVEELLGRAEGKH